MLNGLEGYLAGSERGEGGRRPFSSHLFSNCRTASSCVPQRLVMKSICSSNGNPGGMRLFGSAEAILTILLSMYSVGLEWLPLESSFESSFLNALKKGRHSGLSVDGSTSRGLGCS